MKRTNKTKNEIVDEIKRKEKVAHEKAMVKDIFPIIENMATVYDAQTVLSAVSGFIQGEIAKNNMELKVKDLSIDLSAEKDGDIKSNMITLLGLIENENAEDTASLLERFSDILTKIAADKFLKQSMKEIIITDIIAE